ncbi:MAG: PilZ domain-containing protein [Candidatus Sulfotelmatobacter sp.]
MTHFPQPHPSRRAARVQLGASVLAAIRLEDGRRTKAKLQTISTTGGLLQLPSPLGNGAFVELAFQTQSGPVHGMAEVLSPQRKTTAGVLQPFRFIALEDDDHRRLRTSLDQMVDRSLLGLKSSAFTTPRTI